MNIKFLESFHLACNLSRPISVLLEDGNQINCHIVKVDEINKVLICLTRKGIEAINTTDEKMKNPENIHLVHFNTIKNIIN